jgi:hypothetical protein
MAEPSKLCLWCSKEMKNGGVTFKGFKFHKACIVKAKKDTRYMRLLTK